MNKKNIRQIVLDTETTGMNDKGPPYIGHNIIEIGAIELINRKLTNNNFHVYLKPNRKIDIEAFKIHGISNEFLLDKPSFKDVKKEFLNYISDAELIIHNASFDVGFLDYELSKDNKNIIKINNICKVTDSLTIARKIFPNKRNSLDALCIRYNINLKNRVIHSAFLDAQILAKIFLLMTGGQKSFLFSFKKENLQQKINLKNKLTISKNNQSFIIIKANKEDIFEHKKFLDFILSKNNKCLWKNI